MDFSLVSLTQNDKNSQIPQNSAKTKTKCGFFATLKMTMPLSYWLFCCHTERSEVSIKLKRVLNSVDFSPFFTKGSKWQILPKIQSKTKTKCRFFVRKAHSKWQCGFCFLTKAQNDKVFVRVGAKAVLFLALLCSLYRTDTARFARQKAQP